MIVAVIGSGVQAGIVESLRGCGFSVLDLDRAAPVAAGGDDLFARLGPDFRTRLAASSIDPLVNTAIVGVHRIEEAVFLAGLAPTGVLLVPGAPDEEKQLNLGRPEPPEPGRNLGSVVPEVPFVVAPACPTRDQVAELLMVLSGKLPRVSWDEYFMSIARIVATRSDCVKRKVAALIVKERRIISTGYNGTPRGAKNCSAGGCPRCALFGESGSALGDCLCSHGEENAITQAAYHGISLKGATLYCTSSPCLLCTKMIINGGIAEVVYCSAYPLGERALRLLKEAGVAARQISCNAR